jgi:hypothetical protein
LMSAREREGARLASHAPGPPEAAARTGQAGRGPWCRNWWSSSGHGSSNAGRKPWRSRRGSTLPEAAQDRALIRGHLLCHPHRRGRGADAPGIAPRRDRAASVKKAARSASAGTS